MRLLKFVPIKLTVFLVLGIILGNHFQLPILLSLSLAGILLGVLTVFFLNGKDEKSIFFGTLVFLTTISIGNLSVSLWQPQNWSNHYSHTKNKEGNILKLKIREVLKANNYSNRYIAILNGVNGQKTSGKIILTIPLDSTKNVLQVDDELLANGKLHSIKPPLNPYQFNYRAYLENLGIYHELKINTNQYHHLKTKTTSFYGLAATARNKIIAKLQEAQFGDDELAIIQALLLGQRNAISTPVYDNYKDAGAVHILAVSGLHIGVLLVLLQFLFKPLERLPKGKTIKLFISVLLLWCFAFLAGFSASVVRAVTMFSFIAYALFLNRPSNTFNILALSMFFILLLINPMLLFQVGFQMSYAAVFAIVWVYPMLQKFWFSKNILVQKVWQLFSVSVAAQLGVLPISLFYFHQFPGLFFVSNLLIIPFLGLLLAMGILTIVLALLNALPDFLVMAYNTLIGLMNSVIAWVAQQENFLFKNISFDSVQLVLGYAIIITMLVLITKISFKKTLAFLFAIISFQSWLLYVTLRAKNTENLLLMHQTKNSILMQQQGQQLNVHSLKSNYPTQIITDFVIGERIKQTSYKKLKNIYQFHQKKVLIIDSIGAYPSDAHVEYLVLTQSPKVNLNRVLETIQPKYVIADGSNYNSYIKKWSATCAKRKLPFHYTGEKGAFCFE